MSIDEGVPIPPARGAIQLPLGRRIREAMAQMLVGASYYEPTSDLYTQHLVRTTVHRVAWRTYKGERKFTTRKVYEDKGPGIRFWRTK